MTTSARIGADPRPNQLDWYGAFFRGARIYYTAEVPAYPEQWVRPLARCATWDGRDWYEFTTRQQA